MPHDIAPSPATSGDAAVLAHVRDAFGVRLVSLVPVTGGADFAATVWRATASDGTPYAVKVRRGEATAGLLAAAYLTDHGVTGVPAPLPSRTGQPWNVRDGTQVCVICWVTGRRGIHGCMGERAWRSLGALLGQVHAAQLPERLAARLPVEEYGTAAASLVRTVDARVRDRAGGEADELAVAVAEQWLASGDRIAAVASSAERLAHDLPGPAPRVVTHGDAHVGNVVVSDDGQAWLLDWDDMRLAPPERDLMFVLDWALGETPVTERERSWFFAGYGDVAVDPARLAYYRCTRTLEDVGDWAARVLDRDVPLAEREDALAIVGGLLAPGSDVDRALSSSRDIS